MNEQANKGDERSPRLAAIDVGTNTIRLTVAEVLPDRTWRVVDDEKVVTRLGRGLASTGRLGRRVMEESVDAISNLRSIAEGRHAAFVRAVATCAVREAANGGEFVRMVADRAGLTLEVIGPEDEGRLAFRSVTHAFDLSGMAVAVVDVGGGSTEIVLSSGHVIDRIYPLDVGAVRLSEAFGLGTDQIPEAQYREARQALRERLRQRIGKPPFVPQLVIGTGGTFTNLARMSMQRGLAVAGTPGLPIAVRGHELRRSDVKYFLDLLRRMPLRERTRVPGLSPQRADIIVAGLAIVDAVLKHLKVNRLRVHDEGIRAGLLREMIDDHDPLSARSAPAAPDRLTVVRQFAASCHKDERHAEHVANLALELFDGLAAQAGNGETLWASAGSRELLHSAALLHDVGYLINYSKHHKHTYHLVMHSGLRGFTRRELEIIANVARYHRGGRPKRTHMNLDKLPATDQHLVRRLAAILRLAVGLDRSHAQRISGVNVSCDNGTAVFTVRAEHDPSVDLWGAERKSRLFERTFGMTPQFRWEPSDP